MFINVAIFSANASKMLVQHYRNTVQHAVIVPRELNGSIDVKMT